MWGVYSTRVDFVIYALWWLTEYHNKIRNFIHLVRRLTSSHHRLAQVFLPRILKRVNCEIRPDRPNGPIGESKMPTSTCPTKVGPILSHGSPVGTKAQTCPSRFKKLVLQARETCPASLRGLFSRSEWLAQQVCEACSARKGGKTSLL